MIMKKRILLVMTSLLFITGYSFPQDQSARLNPAKFKTTVELMNGERHKGLLNGCSDSSIHLRQKEGIYYWSFDFKYSDIRSIRIKRKNTGAGAITGGILIGVVGSVAFGTYFVNEAPVTWDQMVAGIVGTSIGSVFAGAAIGSGIESACRKKSMYVINGMLENFSYYQEEIKQYVIPWD